MELIDRTIEHSHVMARKVAAMIQDIARGVSDR